MHYVLVLYFQVKYAGTHQASYWLVFHMSVYAGCYVLSGVYKTLHLTGSLPS